MWKVVPNKVKFLARHCGSTRGCVVDSSKAHKPVELFVVKLKALNSTVSGVNRVVSILSPDVFFGNRDMLYPVLECRLRSDGVHSWRTPMDESVLLRKAIGSSFSRELDVEINVLVGIIIVRTDLVDP